MFTSTDHDKLREIMAESPEHEATITKLLDSHKESVSMITHEIRNPLTLVYSTLQLIEASHPEVHTFRHWDALCEDVLYMTQLLGELSAYNNGASLVIHSLDTSSFLKKIALSYAASMADASIEFTSFIAPDLPFIQADALKLKQVILNLLKNALEAFSPDETGYIRLDAGITNHTSDDSPWLSIMIKDSGCGIPKERLENIFQPFVTYKSGGTGLGLPLSKRIIEAHQGRLLVDSTIGTGTTFTILLPI